MRPRRAALGWRGTDGARSGIAEAAGEDRILWICSVEPRAGEGADAAPSEPLLAGLLDDDERARRALFRTPALARHYTLAHGLLRLALTLLRPEVAPADWRFVAGAWGKPQVAPPLPPLVFSLAHTAGLVAVAAAPPHAGPLGLDVEAAGRPVDLALARRFFAQSEADALFALPQADRARRFFALWTLKESFLKATGLGLALPLDAFSFAFGPQDRLAFARHPARVPPELRAVAGAAAPFGPDGRDGLFTQARLAGPDGGHALALCRPDDGPPPPPRRVVAIRPGERDGSEAAARARPQPVLEHLDLAWDWSSA